MTTLIASIVSPSSGRKFESELEVNSDEVNLLISFEKESYSQIQDTIGNLWKAYLIRDIEDIVTILKEYKTKAIKNIGLLHHGGRYCPKGNPPAGKRRLFWIQSKAMDEIIRINEGFSKVAILDIEQSNSEINFSEKIEYLSGLLKYDFEEGLKLSPNDYFKGLYTAVEKRVDFEVNPTWKEPSEDVCRLFTYMKLLLNSIEDGGNYFSIACSEADKQDFMQTLGALTNKDVAIYTNSSKTDIANEAIYKYGNEKYSVEAGSPLNIPLTTTKGSSGWKSYNTRSKQENIINKDLILHSSGVNPYSLVVLYSFSQNKRTAVILYYSKKFKKLYNGKNGWTKEAYDKWRSETKAHHKF